MSPHPNTYKILAKILARSERQGDCLVWRGSTYRNGYGRIWLEDRYRLAHRLVWRLVFGPIPIKKRVCHTCDNKPCLEPTHLFLGTHLENIYDAKDKGLLWSPGGGRK